MTAVGVVIIYRDERGFRALTEARGMAHESVPGFATVDGLLSVVAEVLGPHLQRQMPTGTPLIALPDVSFTDNPERP